MMAINEQFSEAQLTAAREMILPIADDPAQGEILLCAAAMLLAALAMEGADPLQDAMTMCDEFAGNTVSFLAAVQEQVRFDA